MQTIVVDKDGTELAYLDSGPPSSGTTYTTIFAVHGITFTSRLFYHRLRLLASLLISFFQPCFRRSLNSLAMRAFASLP
jgi:pimeloyl-ACP methyl ester carboxylesterase